MKMKILISFLTIGFLGNCLALNVSQCYNAEKSFEDLNNRVKLGNCEKAPCRLKRNRTYTVEIKLKPERDVEKLVNTVFAFIAEAQLPFTGVDQTDACPNLYDAAGKNKVGCPLKANQQYVYKYPVEVLQIYPKIKAVVHWALTEQEGKDVVCFEVPAKITN